MFLEFDVVGCLQRGERCIPAWFLSVGMPLACIMLMYSWLYSRFRNRKSLVSVGLDVASSFLLCTEGTDERLFFSNVSINQRTLSSFTNLCHLFFCQILALKAEELM